MFAEMIREYMEQSGDSFSQLANRVGVSKAAVAHWVTGNRRPSRLSVRKVCRRLGWDMETEARLLGMFEKSDRKPKFERDTLTDEFWRLMWELESNFPQGSRSVPENDKRLMRIRELVGAEPNKEVTIYDKQKVEELRIEYGYDGNQMSELMGYSKSWYNSTFKKSETFTRAHARKLAEIFGVDVDDLVREDV